MKNCLAKVKNISDLYPLKILYDGGELNSKEMRSLCNKHGIEYVTTPAKASNQNPHVERKIRTIREATMAMLEQAHLPRIFWEEAVQHAVCVQNRLPHRSIEFSSPIVRWEGNANNDHLHYVRVFGCRVTAYNSKAHKMPRSKARPGVYLWNRPQFKRLLVLWPRNAHTIHFRTLYLRRRYFSNA